MKKYLRKLLTLLLCAVLLGSAFAVMAEELEIELAETDLSEINDNESDLDVEPLPALEITTLENADIILDVDSLSQDYSETGTSVIGSNEYKSYTVGDFYIREYSDLGIISCESYDGPGGYVGIPSGVTVIDSNIFEGRSDITGVGIPNTVKEIGWNAFDGTGITSITIPDSVSVIGSEAFYGTALEEVTIPGSVKDMGMRAFGNCKFLKKATLLEGAVLGTYMFEGCDLLEYISIPGSVGMIENQEFMELPALKTVILGEGVTAIESGAFRSCPALSNITLPSVQRHFSTDAGDGIATI